MEPMKAPALRTSTLLLAALLCSGGALAAGPQAASDRWAGADLALGSRLIREHRCDACHAQRVGGTGHAIYRPQGSVDTPAKLRAMVERCSTQLSLNLFEEEIAAIAAVLDRDHYRFR